MVSMRLKLVATAAFGVEAVVKREILALGYDIISTEDGQITFWGDERAIVKSNLWLRTADRVLLLMGDFVAETFEELFQQTKGLPWENLIVPDGKFTVIGSSVKSTLHSVPACQSIVKKAIVSRLSDTYGIETFSETGAEYTVKVSLRKNHVYITVNTSGIALHKRGYRTSDVSAPIKETLAAAMISLSFWNPDRILVDPCCGSGTIPIEAALMGRNIAPGLNRKFAAEDWDFVPKELWKEERKKAFNCIEQEKTLHIFAGDIDDKAIEAARANAAEAGVEEDIIFYKGDGGKLDHGTVLGHRDWKILNLGEDEEKTIKRRGIVVTNPPYGDRIGSRKIMESLYKGFKNFFQRNPYWSLFLITSDKSVEKKVFGKQADRRRRFFNGNIEVCYYQFHGKKKENYAHRNK